MSNRIFARTEDMSRVEVVGMMTDSEGVDWCLILRHETGVSRWVEADTLVED